MLLPWIGKTAKFIDYYVFDYLKEHNIDLTKEQFIVLKYLNEKDGLIQNDLAFITNRSKTALTRLIQNMEKKGLVFRRSSFNDLRINHVYLTPFGKETWKKSNPHFINIAKELQEGISEEEVQVVQNCLETIQHNIKIKTNINQKQR
jgi:DNA-binding MarR family transcriptional regulator